MEEPGSVRVVIKNGWEHTFPNAKYQVDFCTGLLIVYRLVGQERKEVTQFDLKTVRYHEYFVEE
ncbi:MAG: hypothetical protein V3S24_14980 [Candidatus Tectomicrobia bacterium]